MKALSALLALIVASAAGSAPVVIKRRHVPVPRPNRITDPHRQLRDARRAAAPARDARGAPVRQRAALAPPAHTTVVRNPDITKHIARQRNVEVVRNRYYWHAVGGVRYCHYWDGGAHWYGFYHGPAFYWTRYWDDRWWWYDPTFARWVYWWSGYWWWPGPGGAVYVYVDNNYYPYEDAGMVTVKKPQVDQPPPVAPQEADSGSSWVSPDGRRMVQVFGDRSEAFLYDKSGDKPVFMTYLAKGVAQARFLGGGKGQPLRILLDFKDGTFALFDAEGRSSDAETPAAP